MTSSNTVRLSIIQMAFAGSKQATLDRSVEKIKQAANEGAQVICLQELFATEYPCQTEDHVNFDLAEPIDGPTTTTLCEVARKHEVVIVAPIFERRAPGVYHNTAVVIDADGSHAGFYRKMHIPDDPLFYEKFYFAPGDASADAGFRPIATRYAKLGIGVCWDQWYPETARLLSLAGADMLLFPTAIGWIDEEKDEFGAGQLDAWMTVMRSHAIANGIFLGAPNRVGVEGRVEFWGNSFIVSPRGEIISRGDDVSEQIVSADCFLGETDVVRTHWPFLRDRRVDAYDGLMSRWID